MPLNTSQGVVVKSIRELRIIILTSLDVFTNIWSFQKLGWWHESSQGVL